VCVCGCVCVSLRVSVCVCAVRACVHIYWIGSDVAIIMCV
jgi:hypothetical protein